MRHPDDVDAFVVELGKTAEMFSDPLSESRALLYFEALADLSLETVVGALRYARRVCRFFPKPAELRDLAEGSVEDRAREAWRRVLAALEHVGTYESVDFGDLVTHAVIEAMGGWHQAWAWEWADGPELLGFERDFVSLYRLYAQRGPSRPPQAALLGQHALYNRHLGAALRGEIPGEMVIALDAGGYPAEHRALPPVPAALEPPRAD